MEALVLLAVPRALHWLTFVCCGYYASVVAWTCCIASLDSVLGAVSTEYPHVRNEKYGALHFMSIFKVR
jgi:hypothetical protein